MQSNHYVPYGIFIYVFIVIHYQSLIRPWNKVSPIFWIGEPISDSISKIYNINKEKWDAVTLDDVHTHNLRLMKSNNNIVKLHKGIQDVISSPSEIDKQT